MIKRLYLDCETSPNVGLFWSAGYKLNIPYENIIKERAIICICYKWGHEKKTHSLTWDSKQNDKKMLEKFIKIVKSADELVGHNEDKFDLPWIRTRCLFHKIDCPPTFTTLDTLKAARSKFRFNSNRLDYISKFLGIGGKIKTDFNLWREVMNNDPKALKKMVKYCKWDVELLERVFDRLKNHLPAKTHVSGVKVECPECGGKTKINRTTLSAAGTKRVQRQCKECGKHHTTNK